MERIRTKKAVMVGVFIAIALVVGFSYYWVSESLAEKDKTIAKMSNAIIEMDDEIASLNEEIKTLQEKFESAVEFTTLYLKAADTIANAYVNEATANDYYDWGNDFYEEGDFSEADEYWTYSMYYFSYASGYYREAKVFFWQAEGPAPTEDYANLIRKYAGLAESGAKMMDFMYEAAEYYAAASLYYSQGRWEAGGSAVEIGGERIASYDTEVLIYSDLLAEIKVIKDLL